MTLLWESNPFAYLAFDGRDNEMKEVALCRLPSHTRQVKRTILLLKLICFSLQPLAFSLVLTGCGHLAPGVYQQNRTLYDADVALASSYELLHSFVLFESENRPSLSPDVTKAADRIRAGAPQWFASALALRDAYKANPTGANANNLQSALEIIRTAVAESTRYLIQTQTQPAH